MENENVEFDAEVYNETYELINKDDVNITITDEKNNSYPFVPGKTDKAYYLNAGTFPVGNYTYQATVKTGKNIYTKKGEFIITPLNLEFLNSVADHNLFYRIAKAHDGEMFYARTLQSLKKKIMEREDIRPVSYTSKTVHRSFRQCLAVSPDRCPAFCRVVHQEKEWSLLVANSYFASEAQRQPGSIISNYSGIWQMCFFIRSW